MRVLGVDTSLRSTGLGVVEAEGRRLRAVDLGRIHNPDRYGLAECLRRLAGGVREFVERTQPEAAALEGIFYCRNVRTSVVLGEARGVVIAVLAERGIPVFEYPARRVKQAVVGFGGADKSQVQRMVMALLGLRERPQEDAADALAIAVCHLQNRALHAGLAPTPL
jgi:crossover junction endodeoxyribonuclease RuvC